MSGLPDFVYQKYIPDLSKRLMPGIFYLFQNVLSLSLHSSLVSNRPEKLALAPEPTSVKKAPVYFCLVMSASSVSG